MTIKTIKYFPPFSKIIVPADYSFSPTSAGKKNHPTRPSIGCQFGLTANSTPNLSSQSKIRFVQWWGIILNYLRGTFFFSFFYFTERRACVKNSFVMVYLSLLLMRLQRARMVAAVGSSYVTKVWN